MATTVTTLNYLTSTQAGNTLRDNGGYTALSYTPSAAVAEAFTSFTSDGTFAPQGGSSDLTIISVAGGAGGGNGNGCGGGAGGVRTATDISNPGSPVSVTIGAGGSAGTPSDADGGQGGNTFIGPSPSPLFITHGGGSGPTGNNESGVAGGSGSGGGQHSPTVGAGNTPSFSPPQGNPGGTQQWPVSANPAKCGAGGGASGAGQPGPGGRGGGAGLDTTPVIPSPNGGGTFGGGGAGGAYFNPPASGGSGGGGDAGPGPMNADANTGGGGAGQGGNNPLARGGAGGSGKMVVKESAEPASNQGGIWNQQAHYLYVLTGKF